MLSFGVNNYLFETFELHFSILKFPWFRLTDSCVWYEQTKMLDLFIWNIILFYVQLKFYVCPLSPQNAVPSSELDVLNVTRHDIGISSSKQFNIIFELTIFLSLLVMEHIETYSSLLSLVLVLITFLIEILLLFFLNDFPTLKHLACLKKMHCPLYH